MRGPRSLPTGVALTTTSAAPIASAEAETETSRQRRNGSPPPSGGGLRPGRGPGEHRHAASPRAPGLTPPSGGAPEPMTTREQPSRSVSVSRTRNMPGLAVGVPSASSLPVTSRVDGPHDRRLARKVSTASARSQLVGHRDVEPASPTAKPRSTATIRPPAATGIDVDPVEPERPVTGVVMAGERLRATCGGRRRRRRRSSARSALRLVGRRRCERRRALEDEWCTQSSERT